MWTRTREQNALARRKNLFKGGKSNMEETAGLGADPLSRKRFGAFAAGANRTTAV